MLRLLADLAVTEGHTVSVYLPAGGALPEIAGLVEGVLPATEWPPDLPELVAGSPTGAAVFWGQSRRLLVRPPFPITERHIATGYDAEPLRDLLGTDRTVSIVLVRLGRFAVGVCRGERLLTSKTGTGLVHGRHRKGGSSQRRFERRREKQADVFLGRVCTHAREHLEPHLSEIEHIVYGGARTTILSLRKACPFLGRFEGMALPPLLDIPEPKQAVLEAAIKDIWSSRVTEWLDEPVDSTQADL
jgi:hypothetical protein